jgi:ABC-type nitrate/sulfonate/bicarbonate transport system substrate-binding protein
MDHDDGAARRVTRRDTLKILGGTAAGVLAGGVVGCAAGGARPAPGTAPSGAPTAPPAPTKVRIGVTQGLSENMFFYLGQDAGMFEAQGIVPEFVELVDAGTITKALVAREVDFAENSPGPTLSASSKGAPLVLIGASKPKLNIALYVRPGITQVEDLYGKTIGTASPGSFLHSLVVAFFQARGLDLNRVSFANVGPSPVVFQAVTQGKVDAGAATVDFVPMAQRAGNPQILLYFHEYLPQFFRQGVIVHSEFLRTQPDVSLRLLKAWANSLRYSLDHRDDWIARTAQRYERPVDDVTWYFDWLYANRVVAADLEFDEGMVAFMQDENLKSGAQDAVLPFDKVATLDLQRRVVADLGAYRWPA